MSASAAVAATVKPVAKTFLRNAGVRMNDMVVSFIRVSREQDLLQKI
jgi:hypothetical protein